MVQKPEVALRDSVPLPPEEDHRRVIDEEVGDEENIPTNYITIPIIVNLVLIFGYVFLGAIVSVDFNLCPFIYNLNNALVTMP